MSNLITGILVTWVLCGLTAVLRCWLHYKQYNLKWRTLDTVMCSWIWICGPAALLGIVIGCATDTRVTAQRNVFTTPLSQRLVTERGTPMLVAGATTRNATPEEIAEAARGRYEPYQWR